MFIGSTRFTEQISASKYPLYATNQREVSAIIPWRPRRDVRHVNPGVSPAEPGFETSE